MRAMWVNYAILHSCLYILPIILAQSPQFSVYRIRYGVLSYHSRKIWQVDLSLWICESRRPYKENAEIPT